MNLNSYVDQYLAKGGSLDEFAAQIGTSTMYLRHILAGRKPNLGFKTVLGILRASNGDISLQSLRPDLFPPGPSAQKMLQILCKSAGIPATPRPKARPSKILRKRKAA